jgi:type I restriction enzyme R subunit
MTDRGVSESTVEDAALAWLEGSGWEVAHGPETAHDMPAAQRADYGELVVMQRLRDTLLPKLISASCGLGSPRGSWRGQP